MLSHSTFLNVLGITFFFFFLNVGNVSLIQVTLPKLVQKRDVQI